MAQLNLIPLCVLCVLGALAFFGHRGGSFENVDIEARCAYRVANLDAPPADVLFVGASRVGRGIDPIYIQKRIAAQTGQNVYVERIVLNLPNITQFRPLLGRYVAHRGAPKYVVLQLLYNFKNRRQRTWDMPVNNLRNVTFASLSELRDIQSNATLNDYNTVLPRTLEAGYPSLPVLVLQKLEIYIYSALRWPANKIRGVDVCAGEAMYTQGFGRLYDTVTDNLTFKDTPRLQAKRVQGLEVAQRFLPISPAQEFRRYETAQHKALIDFLESEGSSVVLLIMPALGDTDLEQAEGDEIATIFPNLPLLHPYELFSTEIGSDLAKSFADSHHATPYGALIFSRHFADSISEFKF